MPLTGYFDETGHSRDPQVSCAGMAGMVASVEAWKVFETDWSSLLQEYSVSALHMKYFAHYKGDFEGWDEVKRRRFLGRAVDIILGTGGMPVGALVDLRAYRQLDTRVQERLTDPYYMCLNVCVHGAMVYGLFDPVKWSQGHPFVFSNEKIQLVLDQNHELAGFVPKLMAFLESRPLYNGQVGDYTFSSMTKQLPLQAADFIAYEMGRCFKNLIAGRSPVFSWGLQQVFRLSFAREMIPWFSIYDEKVLKNMEGAILRKIEREDSEQHQVSA
jgi:hypothetical protein